MTSNHVHFVMSFVVAFIVFSLIGKWYVWPAVKDRNLLALSPLLLFVCLRVNGLMFLMPGLVAPDLPAAFAVPTAYGDFTAVVLSLIALWAIRRESAAAVTLLWIFNIVGVMDLIYANVSTFVANVNPAQLGTAYYLVVLNVPALFVVHIVIFAYLSRRTTHRLK